MPTLGSNSVANEMIDSLDRSLDNGLVSLGNNSRWPASFYFALRSMMSMRRHMSVCLSARIFRKPHSRTSPFLHVAYSSSAWSYSGGIVISGFVEDIMFSRNDSVDHACSITRHQFHLNLLKSL